MNSERASDWTIYNFHSYCDGNCWEIGDDSSNIMANAYKVGVSSCPETLRIPETLTSESGETKMVEVISKFAFHNCGNREVNGMTSTLIIPRNIKVIKPGGLGNMHDVSRFEIEAGSQLTELYDHSVEFIGANIRDESIRRTVVLPHTLISTMENAIYKCNAIKTIIYCGKTILKKYSLLNNENVLNTEVKVTPEYPSGQLIFGITPQIMSVSTSQEYCPNYVPPPPTPFPTPSPSLSVSPTPSPSNSASPSLSVSPTPSSSPSPSPSASVPFTGFSSELSEDGSFAIVTGWKKDGLRRCPKDFIEIPERLEGLPVVEIMESAFENCDTKGPIYLPETLKRISKSAFANMTHVTGIALPGSLELIGENAFWRCGAENNEGFKLRITSKAEISKNAFMGANVTSLVINKI